MSGYEYDFFISYRRSGHGNAGAWVHNHFHPLLVNYLADEMSTAPRVFIDIEVETGTHWPSRLEQVLRKTRMLVAVWSPPYFRSDWCMAELQTMSAREQELGMASRENSKGLIYPVIFADGRNFPKDALLRQAVSLHHVSVAFEAYAGTAEYLDMHKAMRSIAEELARLVEDVPPWRPNWPVFRPKSPVPQSPELPRLGAGG